MTPDERIEALLNRAGQTINDLPSPIDYSIAQEEHAMEAAANYGAGLEAYILHLTDIIDRMETALENVCGERDFLVKRCDCGICKYGDLSFLDEPCASCNLGHINFKFAGVPEDWRADDE